MRDIPIFTTEFGVASLVFKEIPYKNVAYIHILDAQGEDLQNLLSECVGFCRMAGAERCFAAGHPGLEGYPLHTSVVEMRGTAWVDPQRLQSLFPVTESTVSRWRSYYNERMRPVDNTATLEARDEKRILESGGAYFVHREGELLGIGWLEDTKLLAVAAQPGAGEGVMHTLMSLAEGASMTLEVASTNLRAIRLYEKLGFLKTRELRRWYMV